MFGQVASGPSKIWSRAELSPAPSVLSEPRIVAVRWSIDQEMPSVVSSGSAAAGMRTLFDSSEATRAPEASVTTTCQ